MFLIWFNLLLYAGSPPILGLQTGKLKLPVPDGCPSKIYKLMVRCWAPSLKERPSFSDIVHTLGELPSDSKV